MPAWSGYGVSLERSGRPSGVSEPRNAGDGWGGCVGLEMFCLE